MNPLSAAFSLPFDFFGLPGWAALTSATLRFFDGPYESCETTWHRSGVVYLPLLAELVVSSLPWWSWSYEVGRGVLPIKIVTRARFPRDLRVSTDALSSSSRWHSTRLASALCTHPLPNTAKGNTLPELADALI